MFSFFNNLKKKSNFNIYFTRKKKSVHKTTTTDDKRLQSTLKRIGVNAIPAIEEVNIFKDDFVIQFQNPKGKCYINQVSEASKYCLYLKYIVSVSYTHLTLPTKRIV